ncbi:MAG: tetratricopeptide repeat protein [Azospirillum sp.]|nr:tetratricopeptide repeat protein [Azospirillum sp.]
MKKNEEYTMQDAFIREVDEDLKNESMKKLWDKYGLFVLLIVIVSLTVAVSYESIKSWYIKRAENRTEGYAVALSMQNQGLFDDSLEALDSIINQKMGTYAELAEMQKANILLEQNKEKESLALLEKIANDKSRSQQLRDTALIKLASYRQDGATFEEMSELLSSITKSKDNAWYAVAEDMLATILLRDGNIEQAKEIYNALLENQDTPDDLKNRIKDILSVL